MSSCLVLLFVSASTCVGQKRVMTDFKRVKTIIGFHATCLGVESRQIISTAFQVLQYGILQIFLSNWKKRTARWFFFFFVPKWSLTFVYIKHFSNKWTAMWSECFAGVTLRAYTRVTVCTFIAEDLCVHSVCLYSE